MGHPTYSTSYDQARIELVFQVATKAEITDRVTLFATCTQWEWIPLDTCTPCFGVCRCVMSGEKDLLEEEEEEKKVVELLKNESSTMEGEEMTEEKPAVEKSDGCELISSNTSLLYQ